MTLLAYLYHQYIFLIDTFESLMLILMPICLIKNSSPFVVRHILTRTFYRTGYVLISTLEASTAVASQF